jgi:hypothetical protein
LTREIRREIIPEGLFALIIEIQANTKRKLRADFDDDAVGEIHDEIKTLLANELRGEKKEVREAAKAEFPQDVIDEMIEGVRESIQGEVWVMVKETITMTAEPIKREVRDEVRNALRQKFILSV